MILIVKLPQHRSLAMNHHWVYLSSTSFVCVVSVNAEDMPRTSELCSRNLMTCWHTFMHISLKSCL